jgi:hypothetical protein
MMLLKIWLRSTDPTMLFLQLLFGIYLGMQRSQELMIFQDVTRIRMRLGQFLASIA